MPESKRSKKVIVRLNGGLGNQMFQYAFYTELLYRGYNAFLDASLFDDNDKKGYFILKYFNLSPKIADSELLLSIYKESRRLKNKILRNFFNYDPVIKKENLDGYESKIFDGNYKYYDGYWQSEKYFSNVADEIRKKYRFEEYLTPYQSSILEEIKNCNSVAVHVRRGDYLEFSDEYGEICTESYYQKAFSLFDDSAVFYIFSNDYDYCKSQFVGNRFVIVKDEKKFPECNMDMLLMSKCKHNIIANSSFSWWAAYLNSNENKIVVSPKKWDNWHLLNDTPCEEWTKI